METPIGDDKTLTSALSSGHQLMSPVARPPTSTYRDVRIVLAGLTPARPMCCHALRIDMNTDHTLEEVGKQFDVTRERIRQIEAKALRKLRHPSRSETLRSFLDIE